MELQANETLLDGNWFVQNGRVVVDDVSKQIEWLIKSSLERLADDSSGWDTLYRDPQNGRFWECTYPHSEMHGGGPPRLKVISPEIAFKKYGVPNASC